MDTKERTMIWDMIIMGLDKRNGHKVSRTRKGHEVRRTKNGKTSCRDVCSLTMM